MSWMNELPTPTTITGTSTKEVVRNTLAAKYKDTSDWATWAATLMQEQLTAISSGITDANVSQYVTPLLTQIDAAPGYVADLTGFDNTAFENTLLDAVLARLTADVAAYSTGLGEQVESEMFARAIAREDAERALAYAENVTAMSSRGFDLPPGALNLAISKETAESSKRLADVNTAILHETVTLAQTYNIEMLKASMQYVDILARLHDNYVMRDFEVRKLAIMQVFDAYRANLLRFETRTKILTETNRLALEADLRKMNSEISAFQGVAQAAAQMVSSALNGVNVSSSFGFGGSESNGFSHTLGVGYNLAGTAGTPPTIPDAPP